MTVQEMMDYMEKWNIEHGVNCKTSYPDEDITYGVVVFSESNFPKNWDLCEKCPDIKGRSYIFNNVNKAVIPGQLGFSIFAESLDGSDRCRIERYMLEDEKHGGWDVEECYISDKEGNRILTD